MCVISKPRQVAVQQSRDDKPRPILRNPWLDGVDPLIRARMGGTRSLRIDRTKPGTAARPASPRINSPAVRPPAPLPPVAVTAPRTPTPTTSPDKRELAGAIGSLLPGSKGSALRKLSRKATA